MRKTLFVIDGATGTGKSDLITYVSNTHKLGFLPKYTTRDLTKQASRKPDGFVAQLTHEEFEKKIAEPKDTFYNYSYHRPDGIEQYGFYRSELESAIRSNEVVFVVVRNAPLIERIRVDFAHVQVVTVFIYSDKHLIQQRLEQRNVDSREIKIQLNMHESAVHDYLVHTEVYDDVIINTSSSVEYHQLIENLLKKHRRELPDSLRLGSNTSIALPRIISAHREALVAKLRTSPFERNIFMMMKFRETNTAFSNEIRHVVNSAGFHFVRADDPGWNLTDDVYNPIAVLYCCKFGIALFDEPEDSNPISPNVAYELGVMDCLRRQCLILKHDAIKMPFDLLARIYKGYSSDLGALNLVRTWAATIGKPE